MLAQLKRDDSSTDDFRGVIDDLTVANKKLKRKLKRYEKMYDAHLQDEKLFEVKIHGLSVKKKRELEETLRKFAMEIDETPSTESPSLTYDKFTVALEPQNTTGSLSSTRFAESGYASMSASGQNSAAAPSGQESTYRKISQSAFNRKQANVHSYLHDIPAGLFPAHTVAMSEKSKKKLVVKRLEQIFAGKSPAARGHQQPMQQEEVAQSAAQADREEKEAAGHQSKSEGLREARIYPSRGKDNDSLHQHPTASALRPPTEYFGAGANAKPTGFNSPDQRPTRPLDLDPHRAQVPADNIQYIRHLGFSPPEMDEERAAQDSRHGWIYLNLLVNMAQLHTINVTADFVKKAVADYSSKLELSTDGRKVRWKGGHDVTHNSSGSSSENLSSPSLDSDTAYADNKKRLKTQHKPIPDSRKGALAVSGDKEMQKFIYTPLFFHKESSEEDDSSTTPPLISSVSSPPTHMPVNSSGFNSTGVRTSSSKRRKDDGPIIFYTNAKFCTDLTGDQRDTSSSAVGASTYTSITNHPVGTTIATEVSLANTSDDFKGPLASGSGIAADEDRMDIDDDEDATTSSSSEPEIKFSPKALHDDSSDVDSKNIDFEVSGLGGVQPHDHFAVDVRCQRVMVEGDENRAPPGGTFIPRQYTNKLMATLRPKPDLSKPPVVSSEIISATHKELPVSALPPASFFPHETSSTGAESDIESDSEEKFSVDFSDDENEGPTTMPKALNLSPHCDESEESDEPDGSEESEESEDDEPDDGVLDFLATARALDPESIYAREREYDSAMAERLADEIPTGSSAATAGGGSGFNSPAERIAAAIEEAARRVSAAGGEVAPTAKSVPMTGAPGKSTAGAAGALAAQGHKRKSN